MKVIKSPTGEVGLFRSKDFFQSKELKNYIFPPMWVFFTNISTPLISFPLLYKIPIATTIPADVGVLHQHLNSANRLPTSLQNPNGNYLFRRCWCSSPTSQLR
jgi:hypothetical protein